MIYWDEMYTILNLKILEESIGVLERLTPTTEAQEMKESTKIES